MALEQDLKSTEVEFWRNNFAQEVVRAVLTVSHEFGRQGNSTYQTRKTVWHDDGKLENLEFQVEVTDSAYGSVLPRSLQVTAHPHGHWASIENISSPSAADYLAAHQALSRALTKRGFAVRNPYERLQTSQPYTPQTHPRMDLTAAAE